MYITLLIKLHILIYLHKSHITKLRIILEIMARIYFLRQQASGVLNKNYWEYDKCFMILLGVAMLLSKAKYSIEKGKLVTILKTNGHWVSTLVQLTNCRPFLPFWIWTCDPTNKGRAFATMLWNCKNTLSNTYKLKLER